MKKAIYTTLATIGLAAAANAQTATVPTLEQMAGDFIIVNSKDYNDTKYVADMRGFSMETTSDDSLAVSNFYMKGGLDFKAGYSETTGNFTIPAGTLVYRMNDDNGIVQYLYPYDDVNQEVTYRPITYRYKGNDTWSTDATLVLMSGTGNTELSPYIFAQGSEIRRANATVENLSYDGDGVEFKESRPALVTRDGSALTISNFLTTDQYGYGCRVTGTVDETAGTVTIAPATIGQTNDMTYYRVLAGCTANEGELKPSGLSFAGTAREGDITGKADFQKGTIEFGTAAIWAATLQNSSLQIDSNLFFEFIKSIRVTISGNPQASVSAPDASTSEVVATEYYDLTGRRIAEPTAGTPCIRRDIHADGTISATKQLLTPAGRY